MSNQQKNQGEGNKVAAKQYNDGVQAHIRKGHVEEEAEAAKKSLNAAEGHDLKKAEEEARQKSKGEDPLLYKSEAEVAERARKGI